VRKAIEQEVKAGGDAKVKALQDAREEKARILADEEEAARKAGEEAQRLVCLSCSRIPRSFFLFSFHFICWSVYCVFRRVSEGQKKIKKLELIRRSAQDVSRSQPLHLVCVFLSHQLLLVSVFVSPFRVLVSASRPLKAKVAARPSIWGTLHKNIARVAGGRPILATGLCSSRQVHRPSIPYNAMLLAVRPA